MSLEKKVGQLFVVGLPAAELDKAQIKTLARMGVGGIVLFKRNYQSLDQLVELTNSIQKALLDESFEGLPAWICVDQEGGRVRRFGEPFTQFPAAAEWGALNSPKTCFEAGFVMAKELRAAGVNVNFAPVADVPRSLTEGAIGDRAFSLDIENVANMASAASRGMQKGGVVSVVKHFPGHGGVDVDSHSELPVCQKTVEELEAGEWQTFKRVLRARCEGVMTAHILYPKIDPDRPATMSRRILQDSLRKSLRHSKLIFSDDLEMGAIQKKYNINDAAFLSIEAGCDHVLLCNDWDHVESTFEYVVKAFEGSALSQKRLDESIDRIRDAKRRFLLPFQFANKDLAKAIVGAPEFQAVAESIRKRQPVEQGPSSREL